MLMISRGKKNIAAENSTDTTTATLNAMPKMIWIASMSRLPQYWAVSTAEPEQTPNTNT